MRRNSTRKHAGALYSYFYTKLQPTIFPVTYKFTVTFSFSSGDDDDDEYID